MLKIAKKWPNFALGGQFWLQSDFFRKSPHPTSSPSSNRRGPKIWSPHQKFREKALGCTTQNHSTNGVVVDSSGKNTNTCVRHFESLWKLISHESAWYL